MDGFKLTVIVIATTLLVLVTTGWFTYWISSIDCDNYSKYAQVEVNFDLISGCYVLLDDGRWMPKDQHRIVIGELGGE